MSILWEGSLTPWIDPNGDPYVGAKAYFYEAGTTTPRTTYADAGFAATNDHPVVALSGGLFPAVYLPEGAGDYRIRVTDAAGALVLRDLDDVSLPIIEDTGGGGGDTPVELLARTGDIKFRYGTGAHSGWVRANGRSIGNASSGASERANADTSDLFQFLWTQDASLAVSGGRGASATGDYAANKSIALPDARARVLLGLAAMGNTLSGLLGAIPVDNGENFDSLGATLGASYHTLTVAEMPSHDHGGGTGGAGAHFHTVASSAGTGQGAVGANTVQASSGSMNTSSAPDHNHTLNPQGGGQAHPNVQPGMLLTVYVKL